MNEKAKNSYKNIVHDEIYSVIETCEQIINSLGGISVTERKYNETWLGNKDNYITEQVSKKVYRFRDGYVCVDKIYFPEKPFLVLEFADKVEGPYEDADPFPFDLPIEEVKLEIEYALGVRLCPSWQERAIKEKMIPKFATLMAWNDCYVVYNIYEDAFLLDMQTNQTYQMGDYYGDPDLALIDKHGTFVVVIGSDHLGVFDLVNKELQIMDIDIPDWIVSLNQEGRKIEVICENERRYFFEI